MKLCSLCQRDQLTSEMVAVLPATWNGFNSVANVCEPCQQTRKFKMWSRTAALLSRRKTVPGQTAAAVPADTGLPVFEISHRQTGALLHSVAAASLAGSGLSRAALCNANLHDAQMRGVDLRWADLHLADLSGADLSSADLRAANFRGADLREADLREARLHQTDLRHSLYDENTLWPKGFDPTLAGCVATRAK